MKKGYTHISALLDGSTSMETILKAMKEGFGTFINDQKKLEGDLTLSLSVFAGEDVYRKLYDFKTIDKTTTIDLNQYVADGWTALLKGFSTLIDETGTKLAAMSEDERPEKVLFMVVTDGDENDSNGEQSRGNRFSQGRRTFGSHDLINGLLQPEKKYTYEKLKEKIEHQKNKYNWDFVFLGANIDSFATGGSLGVSRSATMDYEATRDGVKSMFLSASSATTSYRSAKGAKGFSFAPEPEDATKDSD